MDVRPEPNDGEIWEFAVQSNIRDQVMLNFRGARDVPAALDVWLLDEALKLSQDLRKSAQFSLAPGGNNQARKLKLLVGRSHFISKKIDQIGAIPGSFELSQNFPNPFNPITTIRYALPAPEDVTITVFDLLGRKVTTLIDHQPKGAGFHTVVWNGRNRQGRPVASGIYLYEIKAGSFSKTRKMILVR